MASLMYSMLVLTLILPILTIYSKSIENDQEFQNSDELELAPGYRLSFVVSDNSVTFTAIVETTGYVGFGISDSGTMVGADLFIAGVVDGSEETYSGDYHAVRNTLPTRDAVQNWELIDANQAGSQTRVIFSRLFDTGDSEQDNVIQEGEITVIWAIGASDAIQYHDRRGSARLTIRGPVENSDDGSSSTTEQEDGSTTTEEDDGSTTTEEDDGSTTTEVDDGNTTEEGSGSTTEKDPVVTSTEPAGSSSSVVSISSLLIFILITLNFV